MSGPRDIIADNAVVDKASFVSEFARGSVRLPPYVDLRFASEGSARDSEQGRGVGVVRVNVNRGGIALSAHLEDDESAFDVGAYVEFDAEEALELADAIKDTVEGQ